MLPYCLHLTLGSFSIHKANCHFWLSFNTTTTPVKDIPHNTDPVQRSVVGLSLEINTLNY